MPDTNPPEAPTDCPLLDSDGAPVLVTADGRDEHWPDLSARLAAMVRDLAAENAALRRQLARSRGMAFAVHAPEVITITACGRATSLVAFRDAGGKVQVVEVAR